MNNKFVARIHTKIKHKTDTRSLWDRFWRDRHGHVVIWQMPNIWLILWFIFEAISLFVGSHRVEIVSWWLATVALGVWSLFEVFQGVNYLRRLLGLSIATMTLVTVLGVGL
ncbi:MAG TPA: hypothetical protein VNG32_01510 [Candidatus Dormibacteraeota bacterium]|nr:hypothetical protein [Candidatus Dormibacteraeota bacterium]